MLHTHTRQIDSYGSLVFSNGANRIPYNFHENAFKLNHYSQHRSLTSNGIY